MSIRPSVPRTAALTLATVAVLAATAGTAVADPPALNGDDCATTLAHAGTWPGGMSDDEGSIRLVSDAFDRHLSRQASCASDLANR